MDKNLRYERKENGAKGLSGIKERWPRLFMAMAHHRTTDGGQMTFGDKLWLRDIYKDASRLMVIIKCSQVHMTEHALCAMFTFASRMLRGMYILPSKEHRKSFVKDRVDRLKDYSTEYAAAVKRTAFTEGDSNVYKTIYGAGWKFVGSNVRKDFFEFPCSVLFFDEYDELNQDNIQYAYDRVENCPDPYIWKFGNPTFEGEGIHAEYLASDQKEWHVPCEHCGHEQVLEWETHFIDKDADGRWQLRNPNGRPICTACGEDFNRLNNGQWIAGNPGSDVSGYRISRLFVHKGKKPNDIVYLYRKFMRAQYNPTAMQNFYNNYLGVPYTDSEEKITETLLYRASLNYSVVTDAARDNSGTLRAVMGVDQGKNFTVVISVCLDGVWYDIHYANVYRWADVKALEETFNVVCTVIDANGGGYAETRDFAAEKGNRWLCYYRPKDQITKLYKLDYDQQIIATNRTEACDRMVGQYKTGLQCIPPDYKTRANGDFGKQMLQPNRTRDAGDRPIWTKGVDHFFHASVYRTLAMLVSGMNDSRGASRSWKTRAKEKDRPTPQTQNIGEEKQTPAPGPTKKKRKWRA